MLRIGTELMRDCENLGKRIFTIRDIRVTEDGTVFYRPHPYQVYFTEEEIRKEFLILQPKMQNQQGVLERLRAFLSQSKETSD